MIAIPKRIITNAILVSLLLVALVMTTQVRAEVMAPDKLIVKLFDDVNERLNKDKEKIAEDKTYLIQIGNEMLVDFVSFETMAKQILGKNWRKITPDQRSRYITAFQDRIASTVVQQYNPERTYGLEITGSRVNDDKTRAVVSSIVTDKSTGEKFNIAYKMFFSRKTDNWQVYDVVAEGVSVLQSFKTASAEEFKNNGIEFMIAQLKGSPVETDSKSAQ